jgi:short-chain fatty acids transporter
MPLRSPCSRLPSIGFTVVQFAINLPLVLLLLWALGATLSYHPPIAPH